jgi:hypothetical protein
VLLPDFQRVLARGLPRPWFLQGNTSPGTATPLSVRDGGHARDFEDFSGLRYQIVERVFLPSIEQPDLANSSQRRSDPRPPIHESKFAISLRDLLPRFQLETPRHELLDISERQTLPAMGDIVPLGDDSL